MGRLLDDCLAVTGRKYPDGYGFALAYLDDTLNPVHLRDAACAIVSKAYGLRGTATDRKDSDLVAFVLAYANAERCEHYLIEAAQLCAQWGLAGDFDGVNAMRLCGHPGYPAK
jgi:hypothetical protein